MSGEMSSHDDPWSIYVTDLADQAEITVWCGDAHTHDGQNLTPAQARRLARQLMMAAGPEDLPTDGIQLLPMPAYDRTSDLRVQALDMAIRLARPGTAGHIITADAAAFEQYLTGGKVDSEQGQ